MEDAFFESSDFNVISSREDKRCFIVGRTGSGKSAALQHLEEVHPDHVIRISPEDLSLPYITNLQVIRHLDGLEINLDTFWTTLWKHVLLVEIVRHRYKIDSPAAKQNFLANLRERVNRDPAKRAALQYLDEYEGRFWCEADERVREITDKFTERFDVEGGIEVNSGVAGLKVGGKRGSESSAETKAQKVDRFQRIVNDTQLARLNKMMNVLDEEVLDTEQHYTYVVVDDLDRDWVDERITNDLIRCLFRSVLDLKRVRNLKILVALRTNIFYELDFGRRGGGQEEKFRALVLQMRWTRYDLEELLDERVKVASERAGLEARTIRDLLPQGSKERGSPLDYMLDRTLMRPRDAIAYANECLAHAVGKSRLSWADIHTAEKAYSAKRVLALRDEWKPTYGGIDRVLDQFRRSAAKMSKQDFQSRLDDVMMLLSEPSFVGVRWLTEVTNCMWTAGPNATWSEMYQPLVRTLYGIGLVGCAPRPSASPVFHVDDPLFVDLESNLERCDAFFLHPAFHAGLDVQPAS